MDNDTLLAANLALEVRRLRYRNAILVATLKHCKQPIDTVITHFEEEK